MEKIWPSIARNGSRPLTIKRFESGRKTLKNELIYFEVHQILMQTRYCCQIKDCNVNCERDILCCGRVQASYIKHGQVTCWGIQILLKLNKTGFVPDAEKIRSELTLKFFVVFLFSCTFIPSKKNKQILIIFDQENMKSFFLQLFGEFDKCFENRSFNFFSFSSNPSFSLLLFS